MKVTIILPDKDVAPLVQAHLEDSSVSVSEHILKGVRLYNRIRELQADGKTVIVALSVDSAKRVSNVLVVDQYGFQKGKGPSEDVG